MFINRFLCFLPAAWAARTFARSVFLTYEQIRPYDAFGQVMARNLEERGYSLRGLHAFPDIPAQTARYRELGYGSCAVADMNDVYYRLLPRTDVARAERLELFDEFEEWHLMSAHYCIAVAVNELPLGSLTQLAVPPLPALHPAAAGPASVSSSSTKEGHGSHGHGHEAKKGGHASSSSSSSKAHHHHHDGGKGHGHEASGRSRASSGNSMGGVGAGGGSSGSASAGSASGGRGGDSPARVIITDMPAPAPKVPAAAAAAGTSGRSIGASAHAPPAITAPGSSTVLPSQAAAHSTAHSSLSPKELAAAVVQAHEAETAARHSGTSSGSVVGGSQGLQRSVSARSISSSSGAGSGPHGGAAGLTSGGPPSPSRMSVGGRSDRSRSRSRSRSVTGGGGDVDMLGSPHLGLSQAAARSIAAAVEAASGASVEGIEVLPASGIVTPSPMLGAVAGGGQPPSPTAGLGAGAGAGGGRTAGTPSSVASSISHHHHFGGPGPSPVLRGASGPGSVASSTGTAGGGGSMVLHTHAGAVHVMATSGGGAAPGPDGSGMPDFEAIAEAEEEMTSARHLREAVGMDVVREVAAQAEAARSAMELEEASSSSSSAGRGPSHSRSGVRSRSSSFASTSSSVSQQQPHHTPYAPALEGSRAAISIGPTKTVYTPQSIADAARPVSLADVLLPLEQWKSPAAAHHTPAHFMG